MKCKNVQMACTVALQSDLKNRASSSCFAREDARHSSAFTAVIFGLPPLSSHRNFYDHLFLLQFTVTSYRFESFASAESVPAQLRLLGPASALAITGENTRRPLLSSSVLPYLPLKQCIVLPLIHMPFQFLALLPIICPSSCHLHARSV